jgi:hypothetical protein
MQTMEIRSLIERDDAGRYVLSVTGRATFAAACSFSLAPPRSPNSQQLPPKFRGFRPPKTLRMTSLKNNEKSRLLTKIAHLHARDFEGHRRENGDRK